MTSQMILTRELLVKHRPEDVPDIAIRRTIAHVLKTCAWYFEDTEIDEFPNRLSITLETDVWDSYISVSLIKED